MPQTNESATVAENFLFRELNKALALERSNFYPPNPSVSVRFDLHTGGALTGVRVSILVPTKPDGPRFSNMGIQNCESNPYFLTIKDPIERT